MTPFDKTMILAALTAMYVVGAEHDIKELQQDAATEFCDLIELNETEFNELGLTLKNS